MYTPVGSNTPKVSSFRLVAATNQDLSKMVLEKKMRSDFYYRVHVFHHIAAPAQAARGHPLLVEAYMERKGISCALPLKCVWRWNITTGPATCASCTIFSTVTAFGDVALESLGDAGKTNCFSPPCITRGLPLRPPRFSFEGGSSGELLSAAAGARRRRRGSRPKSAHPPAQDEAAWHGEIGSGKTWRGRGTFLEKVA